MAVVPTHLCEHNASSFSSFELGSHRERQRDREIDKFPQLIKPLPTEASMVELGYIRWFAVLLKTPKFSITTSTDF